LRKKQHQGRPNGGFNPRQRGSIFVKGNKEAGEGIEAEEKRIGQEGEGQIRHPEEQRKQSAVEDYTKNCKEADTLERLLEKTHSPSTKKETFKRITGEKPRQKEIQSGGTGRREEKKKRVWGGQKKKNENYYLVESGFMQKHR